MDRITVNITENVQRVTVNVSQLGTQGATGPQGPPGPSGPQNLFIQKTPPTYDGNYLWIELNNDNSIKTFWINA